MDWHMSSLRKRPLKRDIFLDMILFIIKTNSMYVVYMLQG